MMRPTWVDENSMLSNSSSPARLITMVFIREVAGSTKWAFVGSSSVVVVPAASSDDDDGGGW